MAVLLEPAGGQRRPAAAFERHEIEPVPPGADHGRGVGALACCGRSSSSPVGVLEHDVERAVLAHHEARQQRPALEDAPLVVVARARFCHSRSFAANRVASVPSKSTRRPGTRSSSSRRRCTSCRSSSRRRTGTCCLAERDHVVAVDARHRRVAVDEQRQHESVCPWCERSIAMRGRTSRLSAAAAG